VRAEKVVSARVVFDLLAVESRTKGVEFFEDGGGVDRQGVSFTYE